MSPLDAESIVAVALRTDRGRVHSLPRPANHAALLSSLKLACAPLAVQGFLTSSGRFVTREEARVVAEAAGQLVAGAIQSKWLYAEDVW